MQQQKTNKTKFINYLDAKFGITKKGSTFKQETLGGFINFLVVAYVMVLIPNILTGGMMATEQLKSALFLATLISVIVTTFALAFNANMPLVSAPGIGLSTYFATLISNQTYTFNQTITIAFVAGVLFVFLTMIGFRQKLVNALPKVLKTAIPAGIGLFILNIGLNSNNGQITDFLLYGPMHQIGGQAVFYSAAVAILGLITILVLSHYKVKGAIFYGILAGSFLHFALSAFSGINPFASLEGASWLPSFSNLFSETLLKFDFKGVFVGDGSNIFSSVATAGVIIFSYILVDLFDTVGTLVGVTKGTPLVNKNGDIYNSNRVFWIDSLSTVYGAGLGVPGCTVYVESGVGISAGARTGFASVISGLFFVLAMFMAPLIMLIPASATAPALIYIGISMFSSVQEIDFKNIVYSVPAIATIIIMPFTNNIAFGIGVGLILYVTLMLFAKRAKELNWITVLLSVIFIVFFATQNLF